MNANDYQKAALRTARLEENGPISTLVNCALGLSGESGEFADHMKKYVYQGHTFDHEHLKKELGDILWYVAVACECLNTDLETVMQMNVNKLLKRYPNGFDSQMSINRQEANE